LALTLMLTVCRPTATDDVVVEETIRRPQPG